MLRYWLIALALFTASGAFAQQAAPDPAAVAAFQQKATLYSNLLMESRQLTVDMVERIGVMNQQVAAARGKGQAFDAAWETPMRRRAADLKARIEAAPPLNSAELLTLYPPGSVSAGQTAALIEAYPAMLKETHAVGQRLIETAAELGPRAMDDDRKASLGLAGAMFAGMKQAVAAENLQLQLVATTYAPVHPHHALTNSSVASNKAMIEFFSLMTNQAEGRPVDLLGAARRIRAYAEESRKAAETIPALTTAMTGELEAAAKARGAALRPGEVAYIDSYRRSAVNEIAITDQLGSMAVTLAESGIAGPVEDAWGEIEALVNRRFELDEGRRAATSR
jgi:hypothetical protein